MPILLNKTLRLFLDSIGRRDEYEYYLARFQAAHEGSFALVLPETEGFEDTASVLAFDLDFLVRLGLDPLIVLTGESAGMMGTLLADHSDRLAVLALAPGRQLLVETVMEWLAQCRNDSRIPVMVCPFENRRSAIQALVPAVSKRVHLIRLQGALRDANGVALAYYDAARPDRVKLADADREIGVLARWILGLAPGIHLSVASPLNLLEELFTVKGAGCVIRLGAEILRIDDLSALDRARLTTLLSESFNRPLQAMNFLDRIDTVYLEKQYRGAALLERYPEGMYLSKFAVGKAARGEGLAVEIWREITRDFPTLFWRARLTNPFNQWYERHADGYHRTGDWRVYWRALEIARIPGVIAIAERRPDDFLIADPGPERILKQA